jgi:hypothetical protein
MQALLQPEGMASVEQLGLPMNTGCTAKMQSDCGAKVSGGWPAVPFKANCLGLSGSAALGIIPARRWGKSSSVRGSIVPRGALVA